MLFQRRHQCVTHLVIGDQPLFHVCQNGVLLLRTGNDRLEGHQQVFLIHQLTALAHSPESSLIDQIGKVSAHRAGFGVRKTKFWMYVFVGMIASLAGLMRTCMMTQMHPTNMLGMEMNIIAGVVLAGILASTMSTADSQLLAAASSMSHD